MAFSGRLPPSLEPNRLARRAAELRGEGRHLLDLTLSNPTQAGLAYDAARLLEPLRSAAGLVYDPRPFGAWPAREAVSRLYAREGVKASPEQIVLTGSTSEAYGWIFKLLCDPGDEVLAPRPSYPLLESLAGLEAVELRHYPLLEALDWAVDMQALEAAITPRTRAILVVSPNNPTGHSAAATEWRALLELAARRGVALVADEVFRAYAAAPAPSLAGLEGALTFTLNGLSKLAGLPQMKLGWMVVNGPDALRREALERLEWIADAYLPVSAPVQVAAVEWLDMAHELAQPIRRRVEDGRAVLKRALAGSAGRVVGGAGVWSAVIEIPRTRSEESWCLEWLESDRILLQPGYFYDYGREAFVVASVLGPLEVLQEAACLLASRLHLH